jgi:hypothetical protein
MLVKFNCQMAVTLSIANHHASLPITYRRRRNGPRTASPSQEGACPEGDRVQDQAADRA